MLLRCRHQTISFPRRPLIMGIVNLNDDSFCDDGTLDVSAALDQARAMIAAGADIIDAGAESARTNRGPISIDEEISRLEPFVREFPTLSNTTRWDGEQLSPPLLSLNTWRPEVAEAILPLGGDILNDISALPDARNAALCAAHGAALLIMHSVGEPKTKHTHVGYDDILQELETFFAAKIELARSAGLSQEQLILDPGIDFAKQREDNLKIFAGLDRLGKFQVPILLPVSRKTVIGQVLNLKNPLERDAGTVACIAAGMKNGANFFRVHNVAAAAQAVKMLHWLED